MATQGSATAFLPSAGTIVGIAVGGSIFVFVFLAIVMVMVLRARQRRLLSVAQHRLVSEQGSYEGLGDLFMAQPHNDAKKRASALTKFRESRHTPVVLKGTHTTYSSSKNPIAGLDASKGSKSFSKPTASCPLSTNRSGALGSGLFDIAESSLSRSRSTLQTGQIFELSAEDHPLPARGESTIPEGSSQSCILYQESEARHSTETVWPPAVEETGRPTLTISPESSRPPVDAYQNSATDSSTETTWPTEKGECSRSKPKGSRICASPTKKASKAERTSRDLQRPSVSTPQGPRGPQGPRISAVYDQSSGSTPESPVPALPSPSKRHFGHAKKHSSFSSVESANSSILRISEVTPATKRAYYTQQTSVESASPPLSSHASDVASIFDGNHGSKVSSDMGLTVSSVKRTFDGQYKADISSSDSRRISSNQAKDEYVGSQLQRDASSRLSLAAIGAPLTCQQASASPEHRKQRHPSKSTSHASVGASSSVLSVSLRHSRSGSISSTIQTPLRMSFVEKQALAHGSASPFSTPRRSAQALRSISANHISPSFSLQQERSSPTSSFLSPSSSPIHQGSTIATAPSTLALRPPPAANSMLAFKKLGHRRQRSIHSGTGLFTPTPVIYSYLPEEHESVSPSPTHSPPVVTPTPAPRRAFTTHLRSSSSLAPTPSSSPQRQSHQSHASTPNMPTHYSSSASHSRSEKLLDPCRRSLVNDVRNGWARSSIFSSPATLPLNHEDSSRSLLARGSSFGPSPIQPEHGGRKKSLLRDFSFPDKDGGVTISGFNSLPKSPQTRLDRSVSVYTPSRGSPLRGHLKEARDLRTKRRSVHGPRPLPGKGPGIRQSILTLRKMDSQANEDVAKGAVSRYLKLGERVVGGEGEDEWEGMRGWAGGAVDEESVYETVYAASPELDRGEGARKIRRVDAEV